jgi:septum formation protein
MTQPIVLASRSPRRLELLARIGIEPQVRPADVDESPLPGESPVTTALRLARAKASAVARDGEFVLAADTVVALGEQQLGKPEDGDDARRMLRTLSGRTHEVTTGVVLVVDGRPQTQLSTTHVRFRDLTDDEIDWYVATGEGADKAGGYALQGRAAAFVESIHGSHTNVIGLPLDVVIRLLRAAGVAIPAPQPGPAPTLGGSGEDDG